MLDKTLFCSKTQTYFENYTTNGSYPDIVKNFERGGEIMNGCKHKVVKRIAGYLSSSVSRQQQQQNYAYKN